MILEYGVYIPGPAEPEKFNVEALASAAGISAIDARMHLASRLPRRIASERTAEEAAARARELKAAGIDAFVVTRSALLRAERPRARAVRFDEARAILDPESLSFVPGELRLIVLGEILTRSEQHGVRYVDHGYSVERERIVSDRRSEGERFLHLYGESHARVVEIIPMKFNFRGLGRDFGSTLAHNVARFIDRLRVISPDVRFDETLLKFPPVVGEVDQGTETEEFVVKTGTNEAAAMQASMLIALDILRR